MIIASTKCVYPAGSLYLFKTSINEILTYIYGITVAGGDPTNYIAALEELVPNGTPKDKMTRVWYDYFRASALRTAQASTAAGVGGWNYQFELPGNTPYGTTHGSDLAFLFNALNNEGDMIFPSFHEANDTNKELAKIWSKTIAQFVRTGNPNGEGLPQWQQYDSKTRQTLIINAESEVVENRDGNKMISIYGLE